MMLIYECILLDFSDKFIILLVLANMFRQPPSFFCIVTSGKWEKQT